jgi:hypothetical protein
MNALKLAMVGDKSLMQNGIRTSYGFVGDNGELPFANSSSSSSLSLLVNRPVGIYPKWNGPYMSGFDPSEYRRDAWGKSFRYAVRNDLDGYGNRYLSGEIRSAGVDGQFDTTDDIVLTISSMEVAPTYRMHGNYSFANLTGSFRASIAVTFRDPKDPTGEWTSTICTSTFPNYTTIVRDGLAPLRLPIGKVTITTTLFKGTSCSSASRGNSTLEYFISDNINRLPVNLPAVVAP